MTRRRGGNTLLRLTPASPRMFLRDRQPPTEARRSAMPASPVPEPIKQTPAGSGDGDAAVILSLMSHQLRSPCPLLVCAIARRLACPSQSCGDGAAVALRTLADVLLPQWRNTLPSFRH
jgi:hypothetical protein